MRTPRLLLPTIGLALAQSVFGQVPQAFNYQAVARDLNGDALMDLVVAVQFQLHQGTAAGPVVFAEQHGTSTNDHGLFSLQVGNGTAMMGTLSGIDWSTGPFFLEVLLDDSLNGAFSSMGTQQLLSVPYALQAGSSGDVPDGTEVGQIMHWDGNAWVVDSGLYVHERRFGIGVNDPPAPLSIRTRENLKTFFATGKKPNQLQFRGFGQTADSLGFGIADGSPDSLQNRFFIQSGTGHIGIGTQDPPAPLSIRSRNVLDTYFQTGDIPTQDDFAIATDSTGFSIEQGTPTSHTSRLFIRASSGNVGIGSVTPQAMLTVGRRDVLKTYFETGDIPTENDFAFRLTDSTGFSIDQGTPSSFSSRLFVRKGEGHVGIGTIIPEERLHVNGAIKIGNTSGSNEGTIRYTGSDFEGYSGGQWKSLGSNWQKIDNTDGFRLISPTGAGIGIGTSVPDSRLHVHNSDAALGNSYATTIENTASTMALAPSNRIGLRVSNSGTWSSEANSKNIGLYVSSTGQSSANSNLAAVLSGNVVMGGLSTAALVGPGGSNVLAIQNGAPPSSSIGSSNGTTNDGVQLYVTNDASGVSTLHIMDGSGHVMDLHVQAPLSPPNNTAVTPTYDAGTMEVINNMRTRINELESKLQSIGLLD